jgi:hypothetical protein
MLAASAKFRPALAWFARQIAPSMIATLLAALVIAGYNRAFSGHLASPRLSAVRAALERTSEPAVPAVAEADAPAKLKPVWTTNVVEIIAPTGELERSFDKDEGREAAKDQSKVKVADVTPPAAAPAAVAPVIAAPAAAVPAPAAARPVAARPEPRESRPEPRAVERSYEPRSFEPRIVGVDPRGGGPLPAPAMQPMPQPAVAAAPIAPPPGAGMPVAQEPPPVITAKPMVTVPDRPGLRPAYEAQAPGQVQQQAQEQPPAPEPQRQGVLGTIVETLKPSSLFRSAREFGDKIEAAGNDILPNIRQQ